MPRKRTRTSGYDSDTDSALTLGCRKITRTVPSLRTASLGIVACDLRCLLKGRPVGLTARAWCRFASGSLIPTSKLPEDRTITEDRDWSASGWRFAGALLEVVAESLAEWLAEPLAFCTRECLEAGTFSWAGWKQCDCRAGSTEASPPGLAVEAKVFALKLVSGLCRKPGPWSSLDPGVLAGVLTARPHSVRKPLDRGARRMAVSEAPTVVAVPVVRSGCPGAFTRLPPAGLKVRCAAPGVDASSIDAWLQPVPPLVTDLL